MKNIQLLIFLLFVYLSINTTTSTSSAMAEENDGEVEVKISLVNSEITNANCQNGKNPIMYQGETIEVKVDTEGFFRGRRHLFGRSGLTYTYYWSADGLEADPNGHAVNQKILRSSYTTFKIPKLDAKSNATNMVIGVKVRDSYGQEGSAFLNVKVWRPFYLSLDTKTKPCYNILPSEQISGIYTNNSNSSRTISIQDNQSRTIAVEHGQKKGFSLTLYPSYQGIGLFGLGFSKDYFSSQGRSIQQSSSTTISTELLPGEACVFFRQLMFIKNHFNIMSINRCGVVAVAGHSFYHNWVSTYPVSLVDLLLADPLDGITAGVNANDSCVGYEENIIGDNYNSDSAPFIVTDP